MHPDLDERLEKARARTSATDPWVRHDIAALVAATESATATTRRSTRTWVIGGIAAALVLGGATAAVAATALPWGPVVKLANLSYEVTLESGNTCETRVRVLQTRGDASQDVAVPATAREDVAIARTLAAEIDVSSLDVDGAREYLVEHDMVSSAWSEDSIELSAYWQAVQTEVAQRMTAEGANPNSISMAGETHCESDL